MWLPGAAKGRPCIAIIAFDFLYCRGSADAALDNVQVDFDAPIIDETRETFPPQELSSLCDP